MIQPKYTPEEALAKVKLMMKYDLSKTLNENVGIKNTIISEQVDVETDIANKIMSARNATFGTDEKGLVDAIKLIKSIDQLKKVEGILQTKNNNISSIINTELGQGDVKYVREIEKHLKSIGANVNTGLLPNSTEGNYSGGFIIQYGPSSSSKSKTKSQTKGTSGYKPCKGTYTFGCISDNIKKVQECLGLGVDGKYGPKTRAKLKELGYNSFTDADITKICGRSTQVQTTDQSTGQSPWMKSQLEKIKGEKSSFGSTTPSIGSTTPSTDNKTPEVPSEDSMDIIKNN